MRCYNCEITVVYEMLNLLFNFAKKGEKQ
jgi:hypothetical protein